MPHLGCTSLVVVAHLMDRKGIHLQPVVSGHAPLLGQELVLLLGTSSSCFTPTRATARSFGSRQCWEWHADVTQWPQMLILSLCLITSCKVDLMLLLPILPTR